MKKVGVSQNLHINKYGTIQEVIDSTWGQFLSYLNVIPIYLPIYFDFTKLELDGVILTGGGDLYEVLDKKEYLIRDDFEKSIVDFCITKNIPIFGVCRGMQFINKYFGGNLKKIKNHAGCRHFLENGREVNSYHNFGIDNLGKNLKVIDRCDEVIESIKHSQYQIFAQMSHPERENPFSGDDIRFIKEFFDA